MAWRDPVYTFFYHGRSEYLAMFFSWWGGKDIINDVFDRIGSDVICGKFSWNICRVELLSEIGFVQWKFTSHMKLNAAAQSFIGNDFSWTADFAICKCIYWTNKCDKLFGYSVFRKVIFYILECFHDIQISLINAFVNVFGWVKYVFVVLVKPFDRIIFL